MLLQPSGATNADAPPQLLVVRQGFRTPIRLGHLSRNTIRGIFLVIFVFSVVGAVLSVAMQDERFYSHLLLPPAC